MTDFLQLLEGELVDAARRRTAARPMSAVARVRRTCSRRLRRTLVLSGSRGRWVGAVAVLAVAVVAVVLTLTAARGAPLHGARGGAVHPGPAASPTAASPCGSTPVRSLADPDVALRGLLVGDRVAPSALRARAVSAAARSAAGPAVVYARSVRVVRGPSGARVVLVAVRRCHRPAGRRDVLLAVLASRASMRPATLDLGTPARIAARRAFTLASGVDGTERVTMVPAGVRVVLCSAQRGGRIYRFVVRRRLVIVEGPAPRLDCRAA